MVDYEKSLFWSEDGEKVYGLASQFKDKEDFAIHVKNNYEDGQCIVRNIKKEPCLYSEEGIQADTIIPFSLLDIVIDNYYTATVLPIEEEACTCNENECCPECDPDEN
ncbi:hypothetical protein [Brevibacillus sp. DP1.3A]|uniref:hypothetical protein n=1 Tax=Brevibacillus sp. DP1.3A TaxID=2738867 RepID=UPI00156B04C1|nr:hypothetical protein [Brevibacillus sp. DP1.3A]UED78094.1 hypothetical protein HP399_030685 [Brevibacillus sp. DP1.3A]